MHFFLVLIKIYHIFAPPKRESQSSNPAASQLSNPAASQLSNTVVGQTSNNDDDQAGNMVRWPSG